MSTEGANGSAPATSPDPSAVQQAQVAVLIVVVLGLVALVAISGSVWVALVAAGAKSAEIAAVAAFASSLLTIAATCVGGLATALQAPSGIAGVLRSANNH